MAKKKKNRSTEAAAALDTTVRFMICPRHAGAGRRAKLKHRTFIVRGWVNEEVIGDEFEEFMDRLDELLEVDEYEAHNCVAHYKDNPCGDGKLVNIADLLDGSQHRTVMLYKPTARKAPKHAAQSTRAKSKTDQTTTRLTRSANSNVTVEAPRNNEDADEETEASSNETEGSSGEGKDPQLPKHDTNDLHGVPTVRFQICRKDVGPGMPPSVSPKYTRAQGQSDLEFVKFVEEGDESLLKKFDLQADELQKSVTHDKNAECGDELFRDFDWLPASNPGSLGKQASNRTVILHIRAQHIARANRAAARRMTGPEVNVIITFEQRKWASEKQPLTRSNGANTPWPPKSLDCASDLQISQLVERCRDVLERNVRRNIEWDSALDNRKMNVPFRALIPAPDTPSTRVNLSDGKFNVAILADLFRNPLTKNKLEVHLIFAPKEHKPALDDNDLLLYQPDDPAYAMIRVGSTVDRAPPKNSRGGLA